jgi:hypothetical protein
MIIFLSCVVTASPFLRVLTTYGQGHSAVFAEADLRNKFVMATKVLVNRDRGLASLFNSKILL